MLAPTQTIPDLLRHQLQKKSCSCQLHLPPQRAGIKFWDYGDDCVSGELSSEKLIDHEGKRFSDSIIIMQEFCLALAHLPFWFALDRWEYSRDVQDRGDSSGTDEFYVVLLSPHSWLLTAVVGVPHYHRYCSTPPQLGISRLVSVGYTSELSNTIWFSVLTGLTGVTGLAIALAGSKPLISFRFLG